MSYKPITVIKIFIYAVLPVGLVIALAWMNTFHGDEAWVRVAWKGFWLVGLPVLILVGGRMALRSRMKALDRQTEVPRFLWYLKYNEWLPVELFHAILERNGVALPSKGLGRWDVSLASGFLGPMAIQLRDSDVITDAEYRVIVTPEVREKQKIMQSNGLL